MKRIIFIPLLISLFYITKTNAQECGSSVAGPILQQVTKSIGYVDGLFWSKDKLLYVNRFNPHVCQLDDKGNNQCTKLEGINEISSVYTIEDDKNHLIIYADRKVILLESDITQDGEPMQQFIMKTITTITDDLSMDLQQSVTDKNGRTIIGATSENVDGMFTSKMYIIDTDYVSQELRTDNKIAKIGGIVLSSDYKHLFVADSAYNVIYKYSYNERKKSVGKHEIVFNKTEHIGLRGFVSTLGITKKNQLWISMGGSGMVMLYDLKTEKFVQHVKIPALFPSSITYGGAKLDVLFIGSTKEFDNYTILEAGSGAMYAISGTGTVGFQQTMLPMPNLGTEKTAEFKNSYYISKDDLEKMASMEEISAV